MIAAGRAGLGSGSGADGFAAGLDGFGDVGTDGPACFAVGAALGARLVDGLGEALGAAEGPVGEVLGADVAWFSGAGAASRGAVPQPATVTSAPTVTPIAAAIDRLRSAIKVPSPRRRTPFAVTSVTGVTR
jgi:hypothetical protein